MLQKEQGGFGDSATITLNAGAIANETVGIEGHYHVECRGQLVIYIQPSLDRNFYPLQNQVLSR